MHAHQSSILPIYNKTYFILALMSWKVSQRDQQFNMVEDLVQKLQIDNE